MLKSAIVRIVDFSTRHPWWVLVLALVLSAGSAVYAVRHFAIKTGASTSTHQGCRVEKSTMRTMADFSMERGSTAGFHPAALFGLSGGRGNACGSAERQRTIPCALLPADWWSDPVCTTPAPPARCASLEHTGSSHLARAAPFRADHAQGRANRDVRRSHAGAKRSGVGPVFGIAYRVRVDLKSPAESCLRRL